MGNGIRIVSAVLVALGLLWTLQGAGYVGGSFMTGASEWLYIGLATMVVGGAGLVFGSRR